MSSGAAPTASLQIALQHASHLLVEQPTLAAGQAREILRVVPDQPQALLLLAQACARAGEPDKAIAAARRLVSREPTNAGGWRLLASLHRAAGDERAAEQATVRELSASARDPRLAAAGAALVEGRIPEAEALLRQALRENPVDIAAIRMLAEVAARIGRFRDSELLLTRCLELAPEFDAARHNLALVLFRQARPADAIGELDRLLARDPADRAARNLKAAALGQIGEHDASIAMYEALLTEFDNHPWLWLSYGHELKTVGRSDDAIAAYRRAVTIRPQTGEGWWSLANLKTFRFDEADIAAMENAGRGADLTPDDRAQLAFALAKAQEDRGRDRAAFDLYVEANRLRRQTVPYHAEDISEHVDRCARFFRAEFFAERAGWGCPARDPIFIVGMPRSGSTLIEQILSSHPQVEGTSELPDIGQFVRRLSGYSRRGEPSPFPDNLAELNADGVRALGEEYLERTRVQRHSARPFFIDKMPNNWAHVGLIKLILPNATIIDTRRHPIGCCWSIFRQNFARGQAFSYDLADLGRYYADYVRAMAAFDAAQPGVVHRVFYEAMVADPETQIRALLAAVGLDFDPACLAFHKTERAVRTPSSEQVRQPIFTDAVDHWQRFAAWLGPLTEALGDALPDDARMRATEDA
ncbi:Tetratricopeptide repeat-containing protein [Sphingomonas sp. YR710]|uniref:tetratricopeptide repeat-containing sulfotransferase family protein n=1 Tax=Sphingomonas sp. YR710 TaxID=1882773 RepID=UPI00087FB75A|nr:tetratricopeptide repeat-containing sulfotransferase family protein [Sphingomonas sp. YR710]SDC65243.1 Tetratricopeptide repeat-containing protein [Sphingomonas sp. YR710]